MGLAIDRSEFSEDDMARFQARLDASLKALDALLARPGFGAGSPMLGAELELYVVDAGGRPARKNRQLLDALKDPHYTLELNQYNIEYNADPHVLAGTPFSALHAELRQALQRATSEELRVLPIGILPTLGLEDFGAAVMSPESRYQALASNLMRLRGGEPFTIHIDGPEPIALKADHVTFEGANTSFQLHWKVEPEAFTASYNALQLLTPVMLGLAANSPLLLGHRLWQETRIALFKQSIDSRAGDDTHWRRPARVNYGEGWLRDGPLGLFREAVRLYPPLLPVVGDEDIAALISAGAVPQLYELRLHQSTVWYWNRPVYDPSGEGHLRIEIRSLPAGPSCQDMVANAAFFIGAARGLREQLPELLPALPFKLAVHNFYHAAREGMRAQLVWPQPQQNMPAEQALLTIAELLLPVADAGLESLGVGKRERKRWLNVIERRIATGRSGAEWQLRWLDHFHQRMGHSDALRAMTVRYQQLSAEDAPVAEWPLP